MGRGAGLSAAIAEIPGDRRETRDLSPLLLKKVPDSAARFRDFTGLVTP